jgi:hypothetical protein
MGEAKRKRAFQIHNATEPGWGSRGVTTVGAV